MDDNQKMAGYSHMDMDGKISKVRVADVNTHISGQEQQEAAMKAMPLHISAEISAVSLQQIARALTYFMERDMQRGVEKALKAKATVPNPEWINTGTPSPVRPSTTNPLEDVLRQMGLHVVRLK